MQGCDALARAHARLSQAPVLDAATLTFLPPLGAPPKIVCLGLNYSDHAAESGLTAPDYPTLFGRFTSSLIGHGAQALMRQLLAQESRPPTRQTST